MENTGVVPRQLNLRFRPNRLSHKRRIRIGYTHHSTLTSALDEYAAQARRLSLMLAFPYLLPPPCIQTLTCTSSMHSNNHSPSRMTRSIRKITATSAYHLRIRSRMDRSRTRNPCSIQRKYKSSFHFASAVHHPLRDSVDHRIRSATRPCIPNSSTIRYPRPIRSHKSLNHSRTHTAQPTHICKACKRRCKLTPKPARRKTRLITSVSASTSVSRSSSRPTAPGYCRGNRR